MEECVSEINVNVHNHTILTRFNGKYINNNNMQKMILSDALEAKLIGQEVLAEYLTSLANLLEKLEE